MARAAWIGLAIAVILAWAPASADAQRKRGKVDERAKRAARKLLSDGDRNLGRGDRLADRGKKDQAIKAYEAALRDYEAAFDAFPRPQIYFPIALAEEKLGRPMRAFRHYQQLLEEADGVSDDVKAAVRKRLDQVKKKIASLVFVIKPDGSTVSVDGEEIGLSPLSEPHWLVPGEHTYSISLSGYKTTEGTVTLKAGGAETKTVKLKNLKGNKKITPKKNPNPEKPETTTPSVRPTALYLGIGLTGTLAVASGVFGGLAVYKHGRFSDSSLSASARDKARTSGRRYSRVTDGLFVATLAAGAATAYYYYGVYRPRMREEESQGQNREGLQPVETATWAVPYTDGDGVGVAVGGRF